MPLLSYITEAQYTALPEGVREHYKKIAEGDKAGQFVLDTDAIGKLDTIRGTADANARRAAELAAQNEELARIKAQLDELGGLDSVKTLKQQAEEAERKKLLQDGNLADRVRQLETALAAEKKAVEDAKREGKTALQRRDAERALDDHLASIGVDPDLRPTLRRQLMDDLKVEAAEGTDGTSTVTAKWDGISRSLEDALKGWAETPVGKKVILAPDTRGGADVGSPASPKPATTAGAPVTRVAPSDQDAVAANWDAIVSGAATLA